MADPNILSHLQRLRLFERVTDAQLQRIADIVQPVQYVAGQYVFTQGQPTTGAQIFAAGRGALLSNNLQGQPANLGMVEAGQIINEGALLDEGLESASLRILEPSIVLHIPRLALAQLRTQDPALAANLRVITQAGTRELPKVLFNGQRDNETVYRVYHRHIWGFIRHSWLPFGLSALFLVVSILVDTQIPGLGVVMSCVTVGLPVISLAFLLWEWRNDRMILTDQRVVFISMQAWRLTRRVAGVPLDRIGEVQVDVPPGDMFARLFNYGTLVIKSTSDRGVITVRYTPDPVSVKQAVFEHRERFRTSVAQTDDNERVRAQVAEALGLAAPGSAAQAASGGDDARETIAEDKGPAWLRTRMSTASGTVYYRHHWIKWLRMQFWPLLVLTVGLIALGVALTRPSGLPLVVGLPVGFFAFLMTGVWIYLRDWDWRNDMIIVEDNTITFQYKRPLWLQNQVETLSLAQLDNVSSRVGGVIGNLLNVGDISLALVGGNTEKHFRTIGEPESVQAEITWRTQRIKERSREANVNSQHETMAQMLQAYHEMVGGQPAAGGMTAINVGAQTTLHNAPAQPTMPVAPAAPTVPSVPAAPTVASPVWQAQAPSPASMPPNSAPANLTFQPSALPAPPASTPGSSPGSRPPRVPRPRPSDLPD